MWQYPSSSPSREPIKPDDWFGSDDDPDLHTQLESLLDEVWADEAEWRFDDKISLANKGIVSESRHKCKLPDCKPDAWATYDCPVCKLGWRHEMFADWRVKK